MHAVHLGPLVFPVGLLVFAAAVATGLLAAHLLGRRWQVDVEPLLWRVLIVTLLAARLVYVWQFRAAYLEAPLDILDIRDGGWNAEAGIVGGWLAALWWLRTRNALRRAATMALLAASLVWVGGSIALLLTREEVRLPPLAATDLQNRPVALQQFQGQPLVLNLWATWCPPCRREMPMMQQAQAANTGVHFVFLNQGEDAAKVRGYLQVQRLTLYNVLLDAKGLAGAAFGYQALPATLFFDATGRLVETRIGEMSQATLAERLARLRAMAPAQR